MKIIGDSSGKKKEKILLKKINEKNVRNANLWNKAAGYHNSSSYSTRIKSFTVCRMKTRKCVTREDEKSWRR